MFRDIIFIAFNTLRMNKMRSALTMLGIIIGIMVIILMQAGIEGLRKEIKTEIDKLGSTSFFITKTPSFGHGGHDWDEFESKIKLKYIYQCRIHSRKQSRMHSRISSLRNIDIKEKRKS